MITRMLIIPILQKRTSYYGIKVKYINQLNVESVMKKLYKEILEGKKEDDFAVFDFDGTCIYNDIGEAVLAYICENKLLKNQSLLEEHELIGGFYHPAVFRKFHSTRDAKEKYEFSAKALAGYSLAGIDEIVARTIQYEGKRLKKRELFGMEINKGIILKRKTIKLMDFLKKNGVNVWIISASPQAVIETALRQYGILSNRIGMKNFFKSDMLADKIVQPSPILQGKVECIKKYIHPEKMPLLGIGDSINDLPMLKYSKISAFANDHSIKGYEFARGYHQGFWFL